MKKRKNLMRLCYWPIITGLKFIPLLLVSQNNVALPTGAEFIEGISSVNTAPGNTNHQIIIQNKDKAIINWQDFNIAESQITEFRQPSNDAIVLNRVIGNKISSIEGTLKANGQVWLINPSGILFGQNSIVDVAGLLATTSNISDSDFLNSKQQYRFHGVHSNNAKIVNKGQIKVKDSGLVALVAPTVENYGVIEARMGKVALGAGTEFTLDLYGDNLIHFAIGGDQIPSEGIRHRGMIKADAGTVLLTTSAALKVVQDVINMDGFIQANTVNEKNGNIILSAAKSQNPNQKKSLIHITGEIKATGLASDQKGGNIRISGDHLGICNSAKLEASGDTEGGKIHIGGERQGSGTLPHADAVFISQAANIIADAKTSGNGGEIIVWSDQWTRCHGSLSAKEGGFIETSGGVINLQGSRIQCGKAGTYLCDPYNVSISAGANANGSFDASNVWTPSASGSNVNNGSIQTLLNANNNVTITTTNAGGAEAGNITVSAPISVDLAAAVTTVLTLSAEGSIVQNASISRNVAPVGTFNLSLSAPANVTVNDFIDLVSTNPATGGTLAVTAQGLTGAGIVTVSAMTLIAQNANFFGTVNGLADASNISGMPESILLYGPNPPPSRYYFNGNPFWLTAPIPPLPPTPIIPSTLLEIVVPPNAIIPAPNLPIAPEIPSLGDDIIEIESSSTSLSSSDITIEESKTTPKTSSTDSKTNSRSSTNKSTPSASTSTPTTTPTTTTSTPTTPITPSVPPIEPTATSPVPLSQDVPIGGVMEPITNVATELPAFNIEDKAGIPLPIVIYDTTSVKPPVIVSTDNSVGPTGVNGTDVPVGTAGIGSGLQEPVVQKEPIVFKKAGEIIGASSAEESTPQVPCPEAPNCIPGVDSFKTYHPGIY